MSHPPTFAPSSLGRTAILVVAIGFGCLLGLGASMALYRERTKTLESAVPEILRSDIESWISLLPMSPEQKDALRRVARADLVALNADWTCKEDIDAVAAERRAAAACAGQRGLSEQTLRALRSVTLNSKTLLDKHDEYSLLASKMASRAIEGDACIIAGETKIARRR